MPRPYARGLVTVLHDPFEARLEIVGVHPGAACDRRRDLADGEAVFHHRLTRLERAHGDLVAQGNVDRKSTRLNSSHSQTSYAGFCLKKKTSAPAPSPRVGPVCPASTLAGMMLTESSLAAAARCSISPSTAS